MSCGALARIWVAVAGLGAGAALGEQLSPRQAVPAVVAGLAFVTLRRRPLAALAGIGVFCLGAGLIAAAWRSPDAVTLAALAKSVPACSVVGRVLEDAGGLGSLVEVDELSCDRGDGHGATGVVAMDTGTAAAGAAVRARGWLIPLGDDRYDTQLRRLGALAEFDADHLRIGEVSGAAHRVADGVRNGLSAATASLDERRRGLLMGLVVGDTDEIDPVTEERLRRAGLSHLVAVSGSNVAIVLGAIMLAARRLPLRWRLGLAGAGLGLFVVVVGPEASVMRAAAMGAIALAALAWGRRAEPLHCLGLALIGVIGLRPGIVFSVGLHLSAAATAGIVLFSGPLLRRGPPLPGFIGAPLAATVAAQFAVAPVLVIVFGEVSLAGPLANLLALPAVPPATILGVAAGVAGTLRPGLGEPAARLASPAVGWVLAVGDRLGGAPWAAAEVPAWTGWVLAGAVTAAGALAVRNYTGSSPSPRG